MPSVQEFINALHELASLKDRGKVEKEYEEQWVKDVKEMEDAVVDMHENYLPTLEPNIDWSWKRRYTNIYKHLI